MFVHVWHESSESNSKRFALNVCCGSSSHVVSSSSHVVAFSSHVVASNMNVLYIAFLFVVA